MSVPPDNLTNTYARARLAIDQLDNAIFPRSGYLVLADGEYSFLGGDNAYEFAHVIATGAASVGRHTFIGTAEVGASRGGASPFSLGGFRHLAAYGPNRFTGNNLVYGQLTYQFQVASPNGQALRDLYLGTTAEVGNTTMSHKAFEFDRLKKSLSVFVGATTAFGPAYLGFAIAPQGVHSIYLQFGSTF
jgi:NTE family protein